VHIPESLAPLFENGTIERVVRPLMSGKEAQVYLVMSRGELCVAKVYKEAHNRSFKNRAEYTEGRKTRNSRDQRAIEKRSAHGRAQDEAAWKSTEVDMIHRLHAGGVRVPIPKAYIDGVLVMECVVDAEGNPAPRIGELSFEPDAARFVYDRVIREAVRMLAAGVVHGDLSPFNVLAGADGPVIIDFPQSVDAAGNTNARRLLLRDVENFHHFLKSFVPGAPRLPYAEEMWELYEQAALTGETRLTGRYVSTQKRVSTESVLGLIQDADYDESRRRATLGIRGGPKVAPGPPPVYQSKGTRSGSGTAMKLTPRGAADEPAPPRDAAPQRPQQNAQPLRSDFQQRAQGPRGDFQQRPQGPRGDFQQRPQGPRGDAPPRHQGPRGDAPPRHQGPRGDVHQHPQPPRAEEPQRHQAPRGDAPQRHQAPRGDAPPRHQGPRGDVHQRPQPHPSPRAEEPQRHQAPRGDATQRRQPPPADVWQRRPPPQGESPQRHQPPRQQPAPQGGDRPRDPNAPRAEGQPRSRWTSRGPQSPGAQPAVDPTVIRRRG
jgi:RIO kinase 1